MTEVYHYFHKKMDNNIVERECNNISLFVATHYRCWYGLAKGNISKGVIIPKINSVATCRFN